MPCVGRCEPCRLSGSAARLEDGYWTAPYYDCGGFHPMWMITYAVPFFGWDDLKHSVEFK